MPTYDYECDEGHEFEAVQSIKDDTLIECQVGVETYAGNGGLRPCGAPCRRLISNTSFKFKGGPPTPKHYS